MGLKIVKKPKWDYLKFIRWEGDEAIFKKADIADQLICGLGLNQLCTFLHIKHFPIILVRIPLKYTKEKKQENDNNV